MVNKYRVHDTQLFEEEVFMRTTTLSSGDKCQNVIGKSVEKRILDTKLVRHHPVSNKQAINEVYSDLNLSKLRMICDDDRALSNFVSENSTFLAEPYLNVFFLNLELTATDVLTQEDYDGLNILLTWGKNDIYVMPTLSFVDVDDRTLSKQMYSEFVKNMLTTKDSMTPGALNVGISIPSYFRHKDVESIFDLYKDDCSEPSFVAVDFCRAGVDDTKRMGITNKIISHYNAEGEENYYLYGLNVRSFKRSGLNPLSDEMQIARRGFNGFGAPHYRPSKRKIEPATQLRQLGRIFGKDDYRFHPISESDAYDDFILWTKTYGYEFDDSKSLVEQASKVRPVMKKYSCVNENEEFKDVSLAIRKSDYDLLNDKKKIGLED